MIAAHERCIPPRSDEYNSSIRPRDNNVTGAMVLGHSLKDKGAKAKLVVLVTMESLSTEAITELKVSGIAQREEVHRD